MKKLLVFVCLFFTISITAQTFSGWGRKQSIIIDYNQVQGSTTLTDFPFLVTLDHLNSEVVDGGVNSALNGGGDIRFSSDEAGNNRLAIEIVELVTDATPANRKCQIWVKIPSLSATVNTTIYVWYNKTGEVQPASTDTYGSQAVWSNNYVSIWHMEEDPSGTAPQIKDSGINSNNGTTGGSMESNDVVASQIGNGIELNGTSQFVDVGNDSSLNLTSNLTISGWFNPTNFHAFYVMAKRAETVNSGYNILFQYYPTNELTYYDGTTIHSTSPQLLYNQNQWNYVVIKLNAAGTGVTAFLNGAFSTEITTLALPDGLAQNLYLGARSNGGSHRLDGSLDELRVSNVERSNDWIATEYNNQNSPSTFATAGLPETLVSDTQAPTAPILSSTAQTETIVDLSWTASTDDTAVTGYKVYKDGVLETTLGNVLTYQVTALTVATAYNFTVSALDGAGNESVVSNIVDITTSQSSGSNFPLITSSSDNPPNEQDVKAFDENANTKWLVYANTGYLQIEYSSAQTWNSYYMVTANDEALRDPYTWTVQASNDGSNWAILDTRNAQVFDARQESYLYNFTNSTSYTYYKLDITVNNGGNETQLADWTLTDNTTSDTQAPMTPTLSSTSQTETTVALNWTASTDDTAVTGYKVYKDGVLETTLGNVLTYQVTALTAATTYNFTVTALDGAGNESVVSNIVDITTSQSSGGSGSSNWTLNNQDIYYNSGNVGIGTSAPDEKLTVKGSIHSEEVKVDLSVPAPDYVFETNYVLTPLEKLQNYIKINKHLPNIPSAKEMEANGIELGIMNMKLLKKIEELTLYILQQQKLIEKQASGMKEQAKAIKELQKSK